jgi:hypothetical protein
MEESVARHQRTRAACEDDVGECDIYVGIFAWRYGTIPDDDNEARTSMTELEYRRAARDKACLVFLLADEAPWSSTMRDAEVGEGEDGRPADTATGTCLSRKPRDGGVFFADAHGGH